MSQETLEALSEFQVVARPAEAQLEGKRGKYAKLLLALSNLKNDGSFKLPIGFISGAKFDSWLINMKQQGRKKYNIKIGGMVKGGEILIWSNRI